MQIFIYQFQALENKDLQIFFAFCDKAQISCSLDETTVSPKISTIFNHILSVNWSESNLWNTGCQQSVTSGEVQARNATLTIQISQINKPFSAIGFFLLFFKPYIEMYAEQLGPVESLA